jgi:polysaccharide pyruvyl transferase WcaK-like protein
MDKQMTSQVKDTGPRVGLFGLLGSGNIGNDASTEAVVNYLRTDHPDAVIDAMCMGADRMRERYGIETVPIQWQSARKLPGGPLGAGLKVLGKVLDIGRTAVWVRRHDAVIIPGMGIMDASLPINPWGVPWSLFLLSATGRLLRTKVALVSVGATPAKNPVTARLYWSAAANAYYRSFRDEASRAVFMRQGLDTSRDPIYPDLAYSLTFDLDAPVDSLAVGVGVISYRGSNEDRDRADEIYASYTAKMKEFVHWLVDAGRSVRLFVGDEQDQHVVDEILADIRQQRPDLAPSQVIGPPVSTFAEVTSLIGPVATVVAARFHNIVFAVKLGKPTICVSYSPKIDSLVEDVGLGGYAQHIKSLDVEQLKEQFTQLESRGTQVRDQLRELLPKRSAGARAQLEELSRVLFGSARPAGHRGAGRPRAHTAG